MNTTTQNLVRLLAFVSLSAAAANLYAIQNGQADTVHKNVGLTGFYMDGPDGPIGPLGWCTGFVISDHAFVTAAHCVTALPFAQAWAVTLEGGSPVDPVVQPGIFNGANLTDFPILKEVVDAQDVFVHPDYDAGTFENDVAVLLFDPGTFDVRAVRLPEAGYLDGLEANGTLELQPLGLVAYGSVEVTEEGFVFPGYRQHGFCRASSLSPNWLFRVSEFPFDAGTMFGDSGSPQFMAGRAVSLTSGWEGYQRLDTDAVLEFLYPFL